ncbi:MAG: Zn-ribbon domain-containing OB-fold protein [Candidatus Bathyarchaeia archaeon]
MTAVKEFPGIYVKEEDFEEGKILYTMWYPKLRYAWDAGVAIGRYLAELKEGRIIGRKCRKCRRIMVPPRMFCEHCFRPTDEWVYLKDTGTVLTFSLCYVTWDMVRIKEPQIPAVIQIDGASRGMGIMHLLGEVDPQEVRVGMRVKAVWKPPEERTGAITDILYFKPLGK